MPIQLTSSVTIPGEVGNPYTHVRVKSLQVDIDGSALQFNVAYGKYNNSVWEWTTRLPPTPFILLDNDAGPAFTNFVSSHVTNTNELTYDAVARGIYEWLLDNNKYVGTLV